MREKTEDIGVRKRMGDEMWMAAKEKLGGEGKTGI